MNTSTCKNQFLAPDGFCSMCGKNHFVNEATARQERAARQTQEEKIADIEANIEAKSELRTFRDTINLLAELYSLNVKIIWRNRATCAALYSNDKKKGIVYGGYQNIKAFAISGFCEYKSIEPYVSKLIGVKGDQAAKAIACHEFAHLLQSARTGFQQGHTRAFVAAYIEIIALVF